MSQAELFKDDTNAWQTTSRASFFSTKQWTLGLDKIILLVIVTMIFFVLAYSFGFERGRHSLDERIKELTKQIETIPTNPESSATSGAQANTVQANNLNMESGQASNSGNGTDAAATTATEQVIEVQNGKYTIQLATVLKKDRADEQLKSLEKKGMKAFLLTRGKYYEICVGSFDTASSAKPLLAKVRSEGRFADAYIRPMSHA